MAEAHDKRAPFKPKLADGSLGNDYFPVSRSTGNEVSHDYAAREWQEQRAGGSLWDADEAGKLGPRKRIGRGDKEQVLGLLNDAGFVAGLGTREYEVARMFWERNLSYTSIANRLGRARSTIMNIVQDVRRKVRKR